VNISKSNSHEGSNSHAALYNANNEENKKKVFEKHAKKHYRASNMLLHYTVTA